MSGIKATLIPLAVAFAILSQHVYGQDRVVNESYKKWLNCDVFWMYSPEEVGRDFSVKLSFRGAPVGSTQVTLVPRDTTRSPPNKKRVNVTAETDSAGVAYFFSVPPGDYGLTVEHGLFFAGEELNVISSEKSARELNEEWPVKIIPVRNLRGTLVAPSVHNERLVALSHTSVKLLDLRTGQVLASTFTDRDGSYVFSNVGAGLYVLRVTPPILKHSYWSGADVAVELDANSKEETIPEMKLTQVECWGVQLLRKTESGSWE